MCDRKAICPTVPFSITLVMLLLLLLWSELLTYLFSWLSACHSILCRGIGSDSCYIFSYLWVWLQEWTQDEYLSSWKGYKHLTFGVMTTDSLYSILMTGMTSVWSTLNVDLVFWHHLHISMISEYELFPELLKIIAGQWNNNWDQLF